MDKPEVSVVMVVCNVDRFLGEAIESILGQTFKQFEFIIVDFGSTDDSKAIVSNYAARDGRIKLHEIPHCGLAEARNVAGFLARGRYIALMDADDVSLPARLMQEVEFMDRHPEVGVLGGAKEWIDATGRRLFVNGDPTDDREIRSALCTRCAFCQPTVLVRREAFVGVGGYRPPFAPAEDYDLWLRLAEHFQLANLKQVVLRYRIHPHQVSFRKRRQQTLSVLAAQVSATSRKSGNLDPLDGVGEITPALLTRLGVPAARQHTAFASDCRDWIRNMYLAGEYSVALEAALEILQSPDVAGAEARQIADLWLAAARLHRKQKQYAKSLLAIARAVRTRPVLVARPLGQLLRRLESASGRRHGERHIADPRIPDTVRQHER
ncbi:MAG: glycosyltransferase [Candidatus Acidiferrales bacterium]